jgi:ubiquinone/menaquinone biosynthesis C-methylase UbiE
MLRRRYGEDIHLHLAELSPHNLSFITERIRQEDVSEANLHAGLMHGAKLPQADASIDAAFLPEVLEHAPEPWALLDEVARVLKPGGTIVVAARNRTSLWGKRWQTAISKEQVPNQGPFTPLAARNVRAAIAKRFKILSARGIGAGADGDDAVIEGEGWAKARVAVVTATRR